MVTLNPTELASKRGGFALIAVMLTLSALGLLISGLIYVSIEELSIARSSEELLRTRLAAESAVRAELARWRTDDHQDLPIGTARSSANVEPDMAPGGKTTTTVERLDASLFLLRALATAPGGTRSTAAAIVRTIDPLELWRELPATITTTGPVEYSSDDALAGFVPDTNDTGEVSSCQTALETMVAAFSSAQRPPVRTIPPAAADSLRLGPLDLAALRALADRIETGTITPRPTAGDAGCSTGASGNWGAPDYTAVPCTDYFPLIFAPEGLRVDGGVGQGILVVTGDLTFAGDAVFHGVVLVQGRLLLTGRARLNGAALVVGEDAAAIITGEARVEYEPCAVDAAIRGGRLAATAYHPGDRSWIPSF